MRIMINIIVSNRFFVKTDKMREIKNNTAIYGDFRLVYQKNIETHLVSIENRKKYEENKYILTKSAFKCIDYIQCI